MGIGSNPLIFEGATGGFLEPESGKLIFPLVVRRSPRVVWRFRSCTFFFENKLAVVGVAVIVFMVLFCFLGPCFLSHE